MSLLGDKLANLTPEQRKLVELRLQKKGIELAKHQIPPRSRDQPWDPVSFSQQRLWFLDRLEPGNSAYHVSSPVRLLGPLEWPCLAGAVDEIVQRHEALRTRFDEHEGLPVQRVEARRQRLPLLDLTGLANAELEALATRLTTRELGRPFDLARGPLLRTILMRMAPREHAFLINMHHIVSDGWSLGIFFRELMTLYGAAAAGRPATLPPLAIQYADFAVWQRQYLEGEVLQEQLDYWKRQLEGAPPLTDLPLDRPRYPLYGHAGRSLATALSPETTAAVRAFARREAVTPFVVMLSLWAAVLARLSGQEDLPIGSPIAGRNRQEIEPLIGFFVNTMVLRLDLAGEVSLRELVARAQEVNAGASANQDLPFERLVEELAPSRGLDHSPLFQASFSYQAEVGPSAGPGTIEVRPQAGSNPVSMFDLTLALKEGEERIRGGLVANAELFDLTTLTRALGKLKRLVEAALAEPDRPLVSLSWLGAAERHQLLVEWNDSACAASDLGAEGETLRSLLAEQARKTPDRIALSFEDRFLTYGELTRRAKALASRLTALGVGPESVVAVCAPRSVELVIALHGVIHAGAAYLPLDPDLPAERFAFMVEDAGAGLVLTPANQSSTLSPSRAEVLAIETASLPSEYPEAGASPETASPVALRSANAAYVIFTSGSTGTPKGVVNSHRGVVNRLAWMQRAYPLGAGDRVAQKTPFSFDVSVWELFWPFVVGAELVAARPEGHKDAAYLASWMARRRITTVHFVPSMLSLFLAEPSLARAQGARPLPALRWVIASGEALPPESGQRFASRLASPERGGAPRLENLYGPTEAAIDVTRWPVRPDRAPKPAGASPPIPIGRPIDNLEIHLLDRHGSPVPVGAPAELLIGGVGLARGYLNRPALTAERFVPHPVAGRPGARVYRTGDLARRRADGAVEFLGRLDHQVKLRGFRVELGEVESALTSLPGVLDAAVLARADGAGSQRLVAFLVADPSAAEPLPAASGLRLLLAERLPEHMVPSVFVPLEALPKTTSGKVDRKALPATLAGRLETGERYRPPAPGVEKRIAAVWRQVLGVERVGAADNFFDLGGHSLLLIRVQTRLREELGEEIPMLDFFRYPTVAALAQRLRPGGEEHTETFRQVAEQRRASLPAETSSADVAVVGLAARYPKARDVDQFWRNLRDGVDCITFFSREELLEVGVPAALIDQPGYIPARGWFEEPGRFDARLFGISPREAEVMDPQHRVFLECAWEALEHAGHAPETFPGRVGVFAGVGLNYYLRNLFSNPAALENVTRMQVALANDKDFLATRVSYKLDLRGPSVNVQTACSTSLVAVHLACRALAAGECEMALAGGVSISTYKKTGYMFQEGGIASSDGHNRSFDARADGSAGGDGAGIVALRRLADALADGDTIYGVIRGSAINNDGSNKVGFTAPSIEGQAEVIAAAQVAAGVEPGEVGYVETHGTATPLGDPIEVAALREIFGKERAAKSCALGAVKSNIGHTDAAAGAAGLIKTALSLHHRQLPPSLYFEQPNPRIDFENSPLYVNTELAAWPVEGGTRRLAGVSSFGLGGTNAHVVIEEAPEREPGGPSRPWQLIPLSGHTAEALEAVGRRLAATLGDSDDLDLADVAFTLQGGRTRLAHRQVLVARDRHDAAQALASRDPRRILVSTEERKRRPVAWLLPGLGDHYPGMGRELYETEPTFRQAVDACCELLAPHLGEDPRARLFGHADGPRATASAGGEVDLKRLLGRGEPEPATADGPLDRTRWAQPAVFVIEYALAQLWLEWGAAPEAMIGYSLGEYTAACLAGVLSLPDALRLVAERARLIDSLPAGVMLAVPLAEEEVLALLADGFAETLSLAAVSGPELCVVAGAEAAIGRLEERLAGRDLVAQRLRTTHAFHSHMMRPISERFATVVASVELKPPRIPYLSNVTGTWIRGTEACDPAYWVRHLCEPVRFHQGLSELLENPERVLLEVGPGQALSTTAMQHPARAEGQLAVTSLRDERQAGSDVAFLLQAAGRLWLAGVALDWRGFARHERRRRLPLPTYPFQRQRYWIERLEPQAGLARRPPGMKTPDLGDWFYRPVWRPTQLLAAGTPWPTGGSESRWLLLSDRGGVVEALASRLEAAGQTAELVPCPQAEGDLASWFDTLLGRLRDADRAPGHVVHGWLLDFAPGGGEGEDGRSESGGFEGGRFEQAQRLGLYAVSALTASLARLGMAHEISLTVLTRGQRLVDRKDPAPPELATLAGSLTVIPQEYRNLHPRSIDLDPASSTPASLDGLAGPLLAELAPRPSGAEPAELTIAYRGRARLALGYERLRLAGEPPGTPTPNPARLGLRRGGVYLITGGFGYVAGIVAGKLAERFGARLALVGRTEIPPREEWDGWIEAHDEDDPVSRRLARIRELEAAGAEVLPLAADVADPVALEAAVRATRDRFGALHGVFHLAAVMKDGEMMMSVDQVGPARCAPLFRAKVEALHALSTVLGELEATAQPRFCFLFSSMASVLGGLGFTAYAAANAYVDAFAVRHQGSGHCRWLAANWDGWDRVERKAVPGARGGSSVAQYTMSPGESAEAIHRLLSLDGVGQVVVSTGDLDERISRWVTFTADHLADEGGDERQAGSGHARPDLQTPFVAPSSEVEETIAGLWRDLLGIEEIGVHDDFFQLGGDSLLATQLAARIRGALKADVPLRSFFTASTVAQLAELVEGEQAGGALSQIDAMLANIEGLSEQELTAALAEGEGEAPA